MTYPYPPPKNIPTLVPWSHIRSFLDCLLSCKPQRREPKPRPRTCLVPNHHMLPCLCSSRAVRASGFDTRARGGALGCDVCRKGGVERLGARDKGVPVALDVGGGAQPRRRRAQRRHPHVVCRVVTGRARVLEELSANRTQQGANSSVPNSAARMRAHGNQRTSIVLVELLPWTSETENWRGHSLGARESDTEGGWPMPGSRVGRGSWLALKWKGVG